MLAGNQVAELLIKKAKEALKLGYIWNDFGVIA